ncbi:MAG: chorismate lyase [Gammaproteobacteria bacterium]|nr:chorismate lyase [Gammaproteobacteria bacterium]
MLEEINKTLIEESAQHRLSVIEDPSLQWLTDGELETLNDTLSTAVLDWVCAKDFLTDRLAATFNDACQLKVLREDDCLHLESFEMSQKTAQGSKLRGPGRLREVAQRANQQCWIFARSLMPMSSLSAQPQLRRLNDQPLGLFLKTQQAQRSDFSFFTIMPESPLLDSFMKAFPAQKSERLPCLGRCSGFQWTQGECVVIEIFMPRFLNALRVALMAS